MRKALLVTVAALAVAGCGGDDDDSTEPARTETAPAPAPESLPAGRRDEQQIQDVWRRYTKSLGEANGEAVCALLTENGEKELLRGGAAGETCEEVVEKIGGFFKGFENELTDIRVQREVAEAVSPARGQIPKQGISFRREGEEWKIDGADDID